MIDNHCFEKIGFFVSAKGLSKLDTFSNTDPFCVVYLKDKKTNAQMQVGLTDVVMDSQNPDWAQQFVMDYYFEAIQEVLFFIVSIIQ